MKKTKKMVALLAVCMLFGFQACAVVDKDKTEETLTPSITAPIQRPVSEKEPNFVPSSMKELQIYALSEDLQEVEAVTVLVSAEGELTPEIIVEVVLEAMADTAYFVEVAGIETIEDMVTVDFYKQGPPVNNTKRTAEIAILDAIGQSLLDNLPDYNRVSYSIEGEAYQTDHVELALGESYIER